MTSTDLERVPLPVTATPRAWTPQQGALMQFVGLAIRTEQGYILRPNAEGVAEAFLAVCRRTGLDPFARQIYAMETNKGYAIVTGVDGFRVIAQRSNGYRGQIGPQWFTGRKVLKPLLIDGRPVFNPAGELVQTEQEEWVDAWTPRALGLPDRESFDQAKGDNGHARPVAARIGVRRAGFDDVLWQVVTWEEFGVEPRFKGDNWAVRPAHMLGIRAETHGLRRTFPNDLSGIYTPEDFDDDETSLADQVAAEVQRIERIDDLDDLTRTYHELNAVGMPDAVRAAIMTRAGILKSAGTAENGSAASAEAPETDDPAENVSTAEEAPRRGRSAPTAPKGAAREVQERLAEVVEYDGTTDGEFALEIPEGEVGALSEEELEREAIRQHEAEIAAREESER